MVQTSVVILGCRQYIIQSVGTLIDLDLTIVTLPVCYSLSLTRPWCAAIIEFHDLASLNTLQLFRESATTYFGCKHDLGGAM